MVINKSFRTLLIKLMKIIIIPGIETHKYDKQSILSRRSSDNWISYFDSFFSTYIFSIFSVFSFYST